MRVKESKNVELPKCLTTNYYFYHPGSSSGHRRRNEERVNNEAEEFFKELGFNIFENENLGFTATTTFKNQNIEVYFKYRESASIVYKTFKVYRDGVKSNLNTVKKILSNSL